VLKAVGFGMPVILLVACSLDESGLAADASIDLVVDALPETDVDAAGDSATDTDMNDNDAPETQFAPPQIAGLALWLRADQGLKQTTNRVNEWDDYSGSNEPAKNAVQVVATMQPTFSPSDVEYNNQPTVSFAAATNQFLATGTWAAIAAQPTTILVVGNDDGTTSSQFFCDGATQRNAIFKTSTVYGLFAGSSLYSPPLPTGIPAVIVASFSGATSTMYVNAMTPKATGPAGTQGIDAFHVGSSSVGNSSLNGKIAEVVVYTHTLSSSELNSLLLYAASRYNITLGP